MDISDSLSYGEMNLNDIDMDSEEDQEFTRLRHDEKDGENDANVEDNDLDAEDKEEEDNDQSNAMTHTTNQRDGAREMNGGNADENTSTVTHWLDRPPNASRKRSRTGDLVMAIRNMCDLSRARLERYTSSSSPSPSPRSGSIDYSFAKCIQVLDDMPEVDKDLYAKATMKMMSNPQWREAFICIPMERKMWLLEQLESSPSPRSGSIDYSLAECIKVLEDMPKVDKDLYVKATMKMMYNPQWREAFICIPMERKMWLLEQLE